MTSINKVWYFGGQTTESEREGSNNGILNKAIPPLFSYMNRYYQVSKYVEINDQAKRWVVITFQYM
jgi:hypothetical protein